MPISSMDKISQIEAHLFPIMYFNHISYDSFLVGEGFKSLMNIEYLVVLILYGAGLFLLGWLLLKKAVR
jgi:hypothetical protein